MSDDVLAALLGRIAVAASGPVARIFARGCTTDRKADASPVTDADLTAERLILERLAAALPDVPVVAEERVAAGHVPNLGSRFLLVDPLDGTREFIEGRTEFTVNIAMVEGGRPTAGAIYAPLLQTLWFGGSGSHMLSIAPGVEAADLAGARRIKVRSAPEDGLVALVSRSHDDSATEAYLARFRVKQRRLMGSSLKFCRISEGQADIYPRIGETCEWDTAAGHAILAAAGGEVTTPAGRPLRYGHAKAGFRRAGFVAVGGLRITDESLNSLGTSPGSLS